MITPTHVKLVQTSFAQVAPIADAAADLFYSRLFEIAPELRSMFPAELGPQKKRLMAMLGTAVAGLSRLDMILPAVQALGRRHAGYGVTAEYYAPVGAALMWALGRGLGPAFTPAVEESWAAVYATLAGIMVEAGNVAVATAKSPFDTPADKMAA